VSVLSPFRPPSTPPSVLPPHTRKTRNLILTTRASSLFPPLIAPLFVLVLPVSSSGIRYCLLLLASLWVGHGSSVGGTMVSSLPLTVLVVGAGWLIITGSRSLASSCAGWLNSMGSRSLASSCAVWRAQTRRRGVWAVARAVAMYSGTQ
jgi:hypothetical protein